MQGGLAELAPFPQFAAADYLLFLRTLLQPAKVVQEAQWTPWSAPSIPDTPRFLVEAVYTHYAQQLLEPLGVESVEVLRARLLERPRTIEGIFDIRLNFDRLSWFDPRTLGTM